MWDDKKPHFLVGFNPSSSSEALKLPFKFKKHIDGTTPGTAFLLGPSGNTWYANLTQQNDDLFLQDGWVAFVRDHSLESGDSLVFRYDGNLHFTVQVFDKSSCEKESTFSCECSQSPSNYNCRLMKKRDRENSALLDCIIEGIPKRVRTSQVNTQCITTIHELNRDLTDKNECSEEEAGYFSERCQEPNFLNQIENGSCTLKNSVTIAVPSVRNSEATTGERTGKEDLLLSAAEAERVARAFTSSLPCFMKVMKRFNISGSYTLNVPYQFAMAHLPKCKVKIVLHNLKGESWTINSIPTTRVQTSHTFCGGWLGFVRDNNINEGDICIFELVHKCELRVHIVRVRREGVNDRSENEAHKMIVNSSCATPLKISRRKAMKISTKPCNLSLQQLKKFDKKGHDPIKVKCGNESISGELVYSVESLTVIYETSSQGRSSSHTKGCISMKSAPEEKLAAESFLSSFPHFVRVMKKFNVSGSYTLKIPYQFSMQHLPSCRTEVILRNLKGKCWTVNSIPTIKVQTLHTFCGGWMAFVRDNDIQMGDICIFELIGKNELRVHISGVGQQGSDYQSGGVGSNAVVP
ncbi:B3 domain-containing protein Os01g0723500 isoform X1 [Coffea arabica]|uniref:B3 domain-containing protein Os01g0723500 isoform X1 n=1 Tax=Coffea arabica TaxID=13443 RepID=A0A6P6URE7_COFAR